MDRWSAASGLLKITSAEVGCCSMIGFPCDCARSAAVDPAHCDRSIVPSAVSIDALRDNGALDALDALRESGVCEYAVSSDELRSRSSPPASPDLTGEAGRRFDSRPFLVDMNSDDVDTGTRGEES